MSFINCLSFEPPFLGKKMKVARPQNLCTTPIHIFLPNFEQISDIFADFVSTGWSGLNNYLCTSDTSAKKWSCRLKCPATPNYSVRLLAMSRLYFSNRSSNAFPVFPMYWQSLSGCDIKHFYILSFTQDFQLCIRETWMLDLLGKCWERPVHIFISGQGVP